MGDLAMDGRLEHDDEWSWSRGGDKLVDAAQMFPSVQRLARKRGFRRGGLLAVQGGLEV